LKNNTNKKFKIFIFDLDGVLVDSKNNMQFSWQAVNNKFNIKIDFKDYFNLIGRPFEDMLDILKIRKELFSKIKLQYNQSSIKKIHLIKFYPFTLSVIKKLKKSNCKIIIVTSKQLKRTKIILKEYLYLFDLIVCPKKNLKGKPSPDQLNYAIKKLKLKKNDCVYIGDTEVDYYAAKFAKIDFLFADWGYGPNPKEKYLSISNIKNLFDFV